MKTPPLCLVLGLGAPVAALAQSSAPAYTVPEDVGTAITSLTDVSGKLAGSAMPAILQIAMPWFAIGVVFFLLFIAWRVFRGSRGRGLDDTVS